MANLCPFCGLDPYHRVDNGLGMEAVAVTCCELGCAMFDSRGQDTVTIDRDEFLGVANRLRELKDAVSAECSRVIEECAKVAGTAEDDDDGIDRQLRKRIAAAIRDLGKQTGGADA